MRIERRDLLIGTGVLAAGLAARPLLGAPLPSASDRTRAYFDPLVRRTDYSGFVILERAGETLVSQSFGSVDGKSAPHTAGTHYASASIGKMFTRSAILELERAGKLSRGDSLSKYFPEVPAWAPITLGNVIEHKSGIARDLPIDTDLTRPRSVEQLVTMIAAMPIEAKPGETYAYSNNAYRLLARVIELAGGGSYDDLVIQLALEPRGMRDTVPNIRPFRVGRIAAGYQPGPGWGTREPSLAFDMSNFRGAGSFLITPADMLKFVKTLPLEPSDLADAASTDGDGKPKPRALGHDGFGDGYANLAYAFPDEKAYMISLSNLQTGAFTPMHGDLRRLLFGEQVAAPTLPEVASPLGAVDFERYVGDYDLRPGNPLRIRRKGNLLTVDGGDGGHPLVPLGGDRFFMRLRYATMRFEGPSGGPSTLLNWSEGGGAFPLKRIG